MTCQVNKQLVLRRPEIKRAFRDRGVTLLRADWTRRDEEITRALGALGRNGVPVYAFYRPGREPQLLPEILTRDALLAALGVQYPKGVFLMNRFAPSSRALPALSASLHTGRDASANERPSLRSPTFPARPSSFPP